MVLFFVWAQIDLACQKGVDGRTYMGSCDSNSVKVTFLCSAMRLRFFSYLPILCFLLHVIVAKRKRSARGLIPSNQAVAKESNFVSRMKFVSVNKRLIGIGEDSEKSIPCKCGCPESRIDCHRVYNISDIFLSSALGEESCLKEEMDTNLSHRHEMATMFCSDGADFTATGGWCLESGDKGFVEYGDVRFPISSWHQKASEGIVDELVKFIKEKNVTSISDFGAGVGQYKASLLKQIPDLVYHAYDGAGNVENYTKGFVKYFDLSIPLSLPKSDWVLSLEVGEHVPSQYEGMLIRNLHFHNCKGIILSWAVLGQGGHGHVNNHGNGYLVELFAKMGYVHNEENQKRFRKADVYDWFKESIMVFQREESAC